MEFTKILKPLTTFFRPSYLTSKNAVPITIMILSPHPDDECITGSLALRLLHENNAHIINVAVTLGSNKERQDERKKELLEACELLEIENLILNENWNKKKKELKSLIQKYQPDLIIAPHLKDLHPTHVKTGKLCKEVLTSLKKQSVLVAWSEFWGQMARPNLLVEVPQEIIQLQMMALEKHAGEISRNPYHLRLPAWMMDNVRRGVELIKGAEKNASLIAFGVLYQLQICKDGKFSTPKLSHHILFSETDLGQMFKLILDEASGSNTKVK